MGLGRREVHRAQFVTERRGPQRATQSRLATGRRVLGKWNGFGLPPHPFQPACSADFAGTAGHAGRQPVDDTHRSEERVSAGVAFCLERAAVFTRSLVADDACVRVRSRN